MDMGLACPRDFYIHVDGLMFQAKQDGMEFVIQDTNGAGTPLTRGYVDGFSNDHTDWDYNPGLRVGAGFYLDHDAWCLDFNWTWMNITDYKHSNAAEASGTLIPLWALGSDTDTAALSTRSSAVWDASYNVIDARLTKPYHVSRYMIMNPHFGVRAGWIDQHFSVDYSGAGAPNRFIHHGQNEFWGIGTRAGVDTDWVLGKGWCLFGNVSFSMLYGKFEIDQSLTLPSADGFDLKYDYYQNSPNMEIALGLAWGRHFSKNRYHVGLKAGYEFIEWFDQLNMRRFFSAANGLYANDVVSRGNLTMNGFSLKLQLDI
jgi:hypothetical protein